MGLAIVGSVQYLWMGWLSRDGKLLFAVRVLQSFGSSFISVILAVFLSIVGLPLWQIGLTLTGGLLVSTFLNLVVGFLADRVGRRRILVLFGLLTTFSGFVFALFDNPLILVVVAVVSTLGYRGGFGPAQMLERIILAQCSSSERRTRMYSVRSMIGSIANSAGSMFAGMVVLLQVSFAFTEVGSYRMMFAIFALLNLGTVFLYTQLSRGAEIEVELIEKAAPLSAETRSNVFKLSLLFSIDSFGGGWLTSSLIAYWFFVRFGIDMDVIGLIFSASSLLSAASYLLAARISEKIGLINTMVYSHLPANIMTIFIPYMPTIETSTTLFLSRALLGQMDVPTRESYIMAITKPEERSRVGGLINLPRSLTQALSPSLSSVIMQFLGISIPFLIAGSLKSAYDLLLYYLFKDVKAPEEE